MESDRIDDSIIYDQQQVPQQMYYQEPPIMMMQPPPPPPPLIPTPPAPSKFSFLDDIDKSVWIMLFVAFILGFFMGKTMQPVILRNL